MGNVVLQQRDCLDRTVDSKAPSEGFGTGPATSKAPSDGLGTGPTTRHLTFFVHLKNLILILFVQRMFCNGKKKRYNVGPQAPIGEGPLQHPIIFISFFSSAYCNCPCSSTRRKIRLSFLFEIIMKKKNAVGQKWTLAIVDLIRRDIRLALCYSLAKPSQTMSSTFDFCSRSLPAPIKSHFTHLFPKFPSSFNQIIEL